ncbi:MAG: 3-isopropylmalate dehydratase large subunit [Chloroflexi bacterium]|nr:3-isopropylmalate dehydratase large subunit [Chloroflexota bacterium]
MTMSEKILARHSQRKEVRTGDLVECDISAAVVLEIDFSLFPWPRKVWDPDRVWLVADHAIPAPTITVANDLVRLRQFARKAGIKNLIDVGRHGISHVTLSERGAILPGEILANDDSHTAAVGALNCAGRGMGALDMLYILCIGRTWFPVGPTVRFIVDGKMPPGVYARDIIHYVAGKYGAFPNHNVEWFGSAIQEMDMSGRFTIATMCAEISADFALFECDETTLNYLKKRPQHPFEPVAPDADAKYKATYHIDVSNLEPQIALPDSVPNNIKTISEVKGIKIDQAYIGSCANSRLEDIKVAAEIVRGHEIAPWVRFIITPGSQATYLEAVEAGYVATLVRGGAVVTNSTCGACFGGSMGLIGEGETCISAGTRNFKGRMGSLNSRIFLGSPAVVAASAIKGEIADPRDI